MSHSVGHHEIAIIFLRTDYLTADSCVSCEKKSKVIFLSKWCAVRQGKGYGGTFLVVSFHPDHRRSGTFVVNLYVWKCGQFIDTPIHQR